MQTNTERTKAAFGELRTAWSGDEWGDTMHWWFTVADELYFRDGAVPDHWKFRPSPLGPANDPDDYATGVVKEMDSETLVRFGNALGRYAQKLKAAGKDY